MLTQQKSLPTIFKVTATLNHHTATADNVTLSHTRYTFFVMADNGKLAQAKVRLHMRENSLAVVTYCDGIKQPVQTAEQALRFAIDSNALQDVRRLKAAMHAHKVAQPKTHNSAADEFAERYREMYATS